MTNSEISMADKWVSLEKLQQLNHYGYYFSQTDLEPTFKGILDNLKMTQLT